MSLDISTSYPQGHTKRHRFNYYTNQDMNTVTCVRPDIESTELIPITEVDEHLLTARDIVTLAPTRRGFSNYAPFSLNKRELFSDIVEALDEFSTKKTTKYDMSSGMDDITYEVPVVDVLNLSKVPCREDITDDHPIPKKVYPQKNRVQPTKRYRQRSYRYYESLKKGFAERFFVTIDGNKYNGNYIYKRDGTSYVPIVMHPIDDNVLDASEITIRVDKFRSSKTSCTLTFATEQTLDGIVLKPEPMRIENVYGLKNRYIRVLTNDPGFITRFEVYYRSKNTYDQWVKYGEFDGNDSMFDCTKIDFDDQITVKELRIVPITHSGSIDKIQIQPFHIREIPDIPQLEDQVVTYTVMLPHLGKIRKEHSKEIESIPASAYRCDCSRCMRKPKATQKERYRAFKDCCDDF